MNEERAPASETSKDSSQPSWIDKIKIQSQQAFSSFQRIVSEKMIDFKLWMGRFWKNLGKFAKKAYQSLSRIQWIQIIISLGITSLAGYLAYLQFRSDMTLLIVLIVLLLGGITFGIFSWTKLFSRLYAAFIYILVEQSLTRKLVAGGNFSYFEYRDPSQEPLSTKFIEPIRMIITTLFSLLGIAVTIIGIIRIIESDLNVDSPILWGIMALITPILATPIVPVTWAMDDARIKAWSERYRTTWMVSQRYKTRFNSIIAVTAIISNLRENVLADRLIEEIQILLAILKTGALIMLVLIGVFLFFYYSWFRDFLRNLTVRELDLKCYRNELIEIDKKQFEPMETPDEPDEKTRPLDSEITIQQTSENNKLPSSNNERDESLADPGSSNNDRTDTN